MSDASSSSPSHEDASNEKRHVFYHPLTTVLGVIGLYLVIQLAAILLSQLYPLLYGKQGKVLAAYFDNSINAQFLHASLIQLIAAGLLYTVLKYRRIAVKKLGFKVPRWRDAGYALLGFGYYFPSVLLIGIVVSKLFPTFDAAQKQAVGFSGAVGSELILVYIALAVLPPLIEEAIFRGFLYSGLRERLGPIVAGVITCVLFAVAHLGGGVTDALLWVAALDTLVLSTILVYLRQQTDSIWASVFLHSIKNSIAFLSLFIFKTL